MKTLLKSLIFKSSLPSVQQHLGPSLSCHGGMLEPLQVPAVFAQARGSLRSCDVV